MSEKKLKERCQRMMKKHFPSVWYYHPSDKFYSGIPDFLGCFNGLFWAVELKENSKLRPLQAHTLDQIKKAGGLATVCYSVDEMRVFMEHLAKKAVHKFFV